MTNSRRGRGPYPPEFRREAVALYRSSGKSRELGVQITTPQKVLIRQHEPIGAGAPDTATAKPLE
jgi:transposase-like protein